MEKDYNDLQLKDIPKEFLKNHNNSNYKNTKDFQIASTSSKNEIFINKSNNNNSFDNIWLLIIILVIFDLV